MTPTEARALVARLRETVERFDALELWERMNLGALPQAVGAYRDAADSLENVVISCPEDHPSWRSPVFDGLARSVEQVNRTIDQIIALRRKPKHVN